MPDENYTAVLLEEIRHKFDVIAEGLQLLAGVHLAINGLKIDIAEIKSDMATVKPVVSDHSADINESRTQIALLKSKI